MGRIDISEMRVKDVRSLAEVTEELGLTKGRVAMLIGEGKLDYGTRGKVKLVPEEAIRRRLEENPGPGNPNFGTGMYRAEPKEAPEGYMTVAEAAAAIGVSRPRVSQMCSEGTLDRIKEHGTNWVSVESVERRVESGPAKPWSKTTRE